MFAAFKARHQGAKVVRAKKGVGTFVTIDIGPEIGSGRTQLHIWIQYCAWSLVHDGDEILSSDSHSEAYASALNELQGQSLQDIEVLAARMTMGTSQQFNMVYRLVFSGGYTLSMFHDLDNYDAEDDLFTIYDEGQATVAYCPQRGLYFEDP